METKHVAKAINVRGRRDGAIGTVKMLMLLYEDYTYEYVFQYRSVRNKTKNGSTLKGLTREQVIAELKQDLDTGKIKGAFINIC